MSSKRGFPARTALAAALGVAALISVSAPAMADDDGWGNWKHHHGHYRHYIVAPGYVYGGFYAPSPPVVYYAQPAPVYVEPPPPPMVYAPAPPAYYAPPSGLSFGVTVPLR